MWVNSLHYRSATLGTASPQSADITAGPIVRQPPISYTRVHVIASACPAGWGEGIVSKRKDSQYRSGRSPHWIKSKNPNAPAVKREAEEEWGRWPTRRAKARSS